MTELEPERIAATNVLPAFEASLRHGATEVELERELGLTRAGLESADATVEAETTYRHMELMHAKPGYGRFVVAAACRHTASSLGVVGLACKTASTLADAMQRHHRYQHLTNRTARYVSEVVGDRLVLREERGGPDRLGRRLISDYTMLVAIQLLREIAGCEVPVLAVESTRASWPEDERGEVEAFFGAQVSTGSSRTALHIPAAMLAGPVRSADSELSAYFDGVLARASRFDPDESPLLRSVRLAIRDDLVGGAPSTNEVARRLGLGQRTLQRRLADEGQRFADVLESTRRELAAGYLEDPALSLAEIAYLLGYREQSSFFRAFRRWYGVPPAVYRRQSAGTG